jgi:DNA-directed RNA polymerase specialized sigma24 family protein
VGVGTLVSYRADGQPNWVSLSGRSESHPNSEDPSLFVREDWREPLIEPHLGRALADLSEAQRIAVILVHGFGWTLREVAELNGTKVTSVQTHLERGLRKLRVALEVEERA